MIEVKLPVGCRPYQLYDAKKPTRRKPTPPQQRILDQMNPGIWYEAETRGPDGKCKDRRKSCRALVREGWLQMGRTAKRGKDGTLAGDWTEMLRAGFAECFRVLRPEGTLIFKWCADEIPVSRILALTPERPLFGHKSGKNSKTHWVAFLKPNAEHEGKS